VPGLAWEFALEIPSKAVCRSGIKLLVRQIELVAELDALRKSHQPTWNVDLLYERRR